ncbi:hypothetical protein MHU86_14673 [Fragilaria crotonensis]|nr:hypothetical protein MHU86_14673 [Fragilaria crotonensis]
MPHRPESELGGVHSDAAHEMLRPMDAPRHPIQQDYRVSIGAYTSNRWEAGYSPNGDASFAPAPYPHYNMNHRFDSNQEPRDIRVLNERAKRERSDNEVEEIDAIRMANKDDRESPTSAHREAFSVTSESSAGSPFVSGWDSNKKRKKHLDVLRRNRCWLPTQRGDAPPERLTSPVSSVESLNNDNQSVVTTSATPTTHPSRSECFDLHYGQVQSAGDVPKLSRHAVQTEASQYQAVPNFPDVLFKVLSQFDGNGSVLQWVQSGHAWRVVRWDALRRDVLPRYFPQLCQEEEDGSNGGSIDAFLWNVRAWGFEEIKDGPDAGAYAHPHFVRDESSTTYEVQMSSVSPKDETGKSLSDNRPTETSRSPGYPAELLHVPSLAASRSDGSGENKRPDTPEVYQQWRYHTKDEYSRPSHQYYDMYRGGSYGWHYPITMVHHQEDPSSSAPHYHSHSAFRHGVTCPSPYDARYPFRPHPGSNGAKAPPPTAPSSIRSGRGGGRVGSHAGNPDVGTKRRSFPVSQRGKGSRGAQCRTPQLTTSERLRGSEDNGSDTTLGIHSDSTAAVEHTSRTSSSPQECDIIGRKSKKTILLERSIASDLNSK